VIILKETIFLRLLNEECKSESLLKALNDKDCNKCFIVDTESFRKLPGSPFAYWVSEKVRNLFIELQAFEDEGRTAKQGLATADDFRFVRLWWEVSRMSEARTREETLQGKRWVPFAKGGAYSSYYADIHLVVNWESDGQEIRNFKDPASGRLLSRPQNIDFFFHPGLTYTNSTTSRFSVRCLPRGTIFSHMGQSVFSGESNKILGSVLALMNSDIYEGLLTLRLGLADAGRRHYEVGLINSTPFPDLEDVQCNISSIALTAHEIVRSCDISDECSHVFILPALTRIIDSTTTITEKHKSLHKQQDNIKKQLLELQERINDMIFNKYVISDEDRTALLKPFYQDSSAESNKQSHTKIDDAEPELPQDAVAITRALISWTVGVVVGRFDVRLATGERPVPTLPDPFAPLPLYSPGMLAAEPENYPLLIDRDGILIDDESHSDDIVRRVRDVLSLIWKERAGAIENEACAILGVKSLREYFAKPGKGGFFDDHIKRYSKSRRKAPIYWLLQSSQRNYALWLYYNRLDKDMLFKALENYVLPKIQREENRLAEMRTRKSASTPGSKELKQLERDMERQEAFIAELNDFKEKLDKAAKLYLDPELNDGVVLNCAPLREIMPWSEAKKYWDELTAGKYEWSTIGKQLRDKGLVR